MNFRVYKRAKTIGVEKTMIKTQMLILEEAVEGGSTKLERRPDGASMAGVVSGLELSDAMMSYQSKLVQS